MGLRILAMVLRALFIGALVAVTARISSPQSESILTVYETPGDLIRLALGVAGCRLKQSAPCIADRIAEGARAKAWMALAVSRTGDPNLMIW